MDTRYLPMLVPPKPWTGFREGGLLLGEHPAVRGYSAWDQAWIDQAQREGRFDALFRVLDTLGATPW